MRGRSCGQDNQRHRQVRTNRYLRRARSCHNFRLVRNRRSAKGDFSFDLFAHLFRRANLTSTLSEISYQSLVACTPMSASKPAKTLAEVLKELPEEEHIILTMHLLRGLAAPEIANLIGVPERAVTSLISSGKSRLSALLSL